MRAGQIVGEQRLKGGGQGHTPPRSEQHPEGCRLAEKIAAQAKRESSLDLEVGGSASALLPLPMIPGHSSDNLEPIRPSIEPHPWEEWQKNLVCSVTSLQGRPELRLR